MTSPSDAKLYECGPIDKLVKVQDKYYIIYKIVIHFKRSAKTLFYFVDGVLGLLFYFIKIVSTGREAYKIIWLIVKKLNMSERKYPVWFKVVN